MSDTGWIKLHRQIQESALWNCEPFSKGQAWIDLVLSANHKDNQIVFENSFFDIKRGQHLTSIRILSAKWKWSAGKVNRFLKMLEDDDMIKKECFKNGTLLTIVKYDFYQDARNTNGTPTDTPTDTPIDTQTERERNADGTQTETNKNEKNDKNDKEGKNNTPLNPPKRSRNKKEFIPPTLEEVKAYAESRGNIIDPIEFFDFFEAGDWIDSQGNPVICWKQKYITWEHKRTEKNKKQDDSEWGHII